MSHKIKFIDLFAGLGGIRIGFEQACREIGIDYECVLTSEIKQHAIDTLNHNHPNSLFVGDITNIKNEDIPKFDYLFAGFPCQPFSISGKRNGFSDTRGTLFFEIERIIKYHQPTGFILENVEGLVKHDLENKGDNIGRTLKTILYKLEHELNYQVSWKVLDGVDFGVPQSRKRIYIVGTKNIKVDLDDFKSTYCRVKDILEIGKPILNTNFTKKLFENYTIYQLYGKSIRDKRGGENNIHSWQIGIKGECSPNQINLLNRLFKERRKKHYATEIGIDWMDGMPLTLSQIISFLPIKTTFINIDVQSLLDDLIEKGYIKFEYPKKLINEFTENGVISSRIYDETKSKGYNIVTGKLSFEINKILNPYEIAPTLVATDMCKIAVPDGNGIRKLTIREGLRMFGYPEDYDINIKDNLAYDLLGNTVVIPVIKAISERILQQLYQI